VSELMNPSKEPESVRQMYGAWAGEPLFSVAMNYIDSTTLRYEENSGIWRERYGNSEERWIRTGVRPNRLDWGFNSVGWTQEVVTRYSNQPPPLPALGVGAIPGARYALLPSTAIRRNSSVGGGDAPS